MSAWEVFWKDEVSQFQFEGKVFRSNRDVFHFLARNNKIYCKSYLICEHFLSRNCSLREAHWTKR